MIVDMLKAIAERIVSTPYFLMGLWFGYFLSCFIIGGVYLPLGAIVVSLAWLAGFIVWQGRKQ